MTNKTIQKIMALPLSQRIEFLQTAVTVTNNVAEPFEQKVIGELLSDNITSWVITAAVTEYKRVIDVVVQHAGTSKDLTGEFLVIAQKFQKSQQLKSDAVAFALVLILQKYYITR
jgi:hypothetical protein